MRLVARFDRVKQVRHLLLRRHTIAYTGDRMKAAGGSNPRDAHTVGLLESISEA